MNYKRLIALILAILMIVGSLTALAACVPSVPEVPEIPGSDDKDKEDEEDDKNDDVVEPSFKDYGRGTVDFGALSYARPSVETVVEALNRARDAIADNTLSYEEQLALLKAVNEPYYEYVSMYNLANIYTKKDASSAFWNEEYAYASMNYPSISQAVEEMYIAAANSPHIESFEADYYGEGLYEDYGEKDALSDVLVELYKEEARLVSEYNGISTSNLIISFEGKTGTLDELIEEAEKTYGANTHEYETMVSMYQYAYSLAHSDKSCDIYVELVKVRRSIADESGVDSYADLIYEDMGYDYTKEDMLELFGEVGEYIYTIYRQLVQELYTHLIENAAATLSPSYLVNSLYNVYQATDAELADCYAYMLQHGLYDVAKSSANRAAISFTTYIEKNSSPYLFVTANGNITDYSTMAHEFGHFYDGFVNYNRSSSLEGMEVSSQALEYLTLSMLESRVSAKNYKYLKYYYMLSIFDTMIYQSIYSTFEHMVYELAYDEISRDNIDALVGDACKHITGSNQVYLPNYYGQDAPVFDDLSDVMIPHLIIQPMYVQSYVTSLVPALEIYFTEVETEGAGLTLYKSFIAAAGEAEGFIELLGATGLRSPFEDGVMEDLANDIYLNVLGKRYFNTTDKNNAA